MGWVLSTVLSDHCARTEVTMTDEITLQPIGYVRGGRNQPVDDHWQGIESTIELTDRYLPESLAGLDEFSHLDIVYFFNRVDPGDVVESARHPRANPAWPRVGIFAQRARMRPNRIGVGTCRLMNVEGRCVHVADLDAMDGTPVLDIKPHMVEMGPRTEVVEPGWATELMEHYWA
jgi:tRNA-Thr(GGU) m(6)t(6)A37 methyltransferase TsaA